MGISPCIFPLDLSLLMDTIPTWIVHSLHSLPCRQLTMASPYMRGTPWLMIFSSPSTHLYGNGYLCHESCTQQLQLHVSNLNWNGSIFPLSLETVDLVPKNCTYVEVVIHFGWHSVDLWLSFPSTPGWWFTYPVQGHSTKSV